MIAQVAIAALVGTGPNAHAYRVTIHSRPATQIVERVQVPAGWVGAFCTPRVCAVGQVTVVVPASGLAVSLLHLYRESAAAPDRFAIVLSAGGAKLVLKA